MNTFFTEYGNQLEAIFGEAKQAYAGLSAEALDWRPREDVNSMVVLVVHLAAATRFWLGDMAAGKPSQPPRDRPAEFAAAGLNHAQLDERLDQTLAECRAILAELDLADLASERYSERHGRNFSAAWSILHAMEHAALHVGHMQITRQWWEERPGVV